MRFFAWFAVALPVLLAAMGTASAFMIYPDRDNPDALIVLIEQTYGDLVEFRMLPKPYDTVVQTAQGPDTFSFRWKYAREPQHGMAFLTVDEDGLGVVEFQFWGEGLKDGDTLAAAAVLVDKDAKPLHAFYAKADFVGMSFPDGRDRHQVRLFAEHEPDWWSRVDGIAFFYMKYFAQQRPDEAGVWESMERAVLFFTKGAASPSERG
ncbi:MAG TPA: hypothetical protein VMF90_18950 [Rhizobiaceae bacterium]|nr:hypothetical protein [Rhizobiaceae bacterium]